MVYLKLVFLNLICREALINIFRISERFCTDFMRVEFDGTVETRIEEPTFLDDSLLKALVFCLYNPYIRDGGNVSLIKTCKNCIFMTVVFSPIIYFTFYAIFVKMLYRISASRFL